MAQAGDSGLETRRRAAATRLEQPADRVRLVISPYRVCPIGAHIDHQGGPVLGMAVSAHSLLAFAPRRDDRCRIRSENYRGEVGFALSEPAGCGPPHTGWGRYARGAAAVLAERLPARPRGIDAWLAGALPGGGLSSSASVTLAYLTALAAANGVSIPTAERIELARRVENEFAGVACGILDPASIAAARRDHLLAIDTRRGHWQPAPLGPGAGPLRILVAYTGIPRDLARTGFNRRVEECRAAARALGARAGRGDVTRLGDLGDAEIDAHLAGIDPLSARRARHFRGERSRVRAGLRCWRDGDLAGFGELMNASCESSRVHFETGSPELIRLQEILLATPGVYGSRFSGAGFGGCAVAFVEGPAADEVAEHVERSFAEAFPALAGAARCFAVDSDDALRIR